MSQSTMELQASYTFMDRSSGHPDSARVLLLAGPQHLDWGLYEVCLLPGGKEWAPPEPVTRELARLIESGKRYPPALALAREEVNQLFVDQQPTHDELAAAYTRALRTHLARQQDAPYVMAQALTDDGRYRNRGEWYWVLEVAGIQPVATWVTRDYHIHDCMMIDFDLTGQQLKKLGYVV